MVENSNGNGNSKSADQPHKLKRRFPKGVARWKPGVSGNPLGPGRIVRFTDRLQFILAEPQTPGERESGSKLDVLCRKAIEYAMDGDAKFMALILERIDPATRYRVSMNVNTGASPATILAHLRSLGAQCLPDSPTLPPLPIIDVKAVPQDDTIAGDPT